MFDVFIYDIYKQKLHMRKVKLYICLQTFYAATHMLAMPTT